MNEKDLAAELQASKDDPEEWGDAAPPASSGKRAKRRLAAMVSVRLSPEELRRVQERATDRGTTVSAYVRALALRDLTEADCAPSVVSRALVSISTGVTYLPRISSSRNTVDGSRLPTSAGPQRPTTLPEAGAP